MLLGYFVAVYSVFMATYVLVRRKIHEIEKIMRNTLDKIINTAVYHKSKWV